MVRPIGSGRGNARRHERNRERNGLSWRLIAELIQKSADPMLTGKRAEPKEDHMEDTQSLTVRRVNPALGVEVTGVDLADPAFKADGAKVFGTIYQAWLDSGGLMVVRDQSSHQKIISTSLGDLARSTRLRARRLVRTCTPITRKSIGCLTK